MGEDYRFRTKLFYTGRISDGILNGDIIILGSGDPTLGSNHIKGSLPLDSLMMSWTTAIRKAGIQKIEGHIIADDHVFDKQSIPDFWNWRDIGNYYAAGTSGLTIHDNLYYLVLQPGSWIGAPVKIIGTEPDIPELEFINKLKTADRGTGDNAYLYAGPGQYNFDLTGTIPKGKNVFRIKGALPDPALFCAQHLKNQLKNDGIPTKGECRILNIDKRVTKRTPITETISPPLKDIIYYLNKRSINLYAEQLVKTIAVEQGKAGSLKNGLNLIKQFLEDNDIPLDGIRLDDGSGLSHTNTLTTYSMVSLLKVLFGHPAFDSFYNSLGIAGDPDDIGFFSSFGRGSLLEKNARIKSGTIPNIRSHSGYLQDTAGKWIAFSLIANNYSASMGQINKQHLKILKALAELP